MTTARLTKPQLRVVEALQNGGYIWVAGGFPYLATTDLQGRVTSKQLNKKVFENLKDLRVIEETMKNGHFNLRVS